MSDEGRILTPEEYAEIEAYMEATEADYEAMLECIGRIIAEGMTEGRFNERQVQHDLDVALLIAFACINLYDYEHSCTACDWLSRVEDLAPGCGEWYYRYSNALMYCGKPSIAMEYASRGVDEAPDYPWNWLTLGRLRAHYHDIDGAIAAVQRGLEIVPDNWEFISLMEDISMGRSLEQMEYHAIDPENDTGVDIDVERIFHEGSGEDVTRAAAIMGINVNRRNLNAIREAIGASGWIADHPFCTCEVTTANGPLMMIFTMNEAFLSKMAPEDVRAIVDNVPQMLLAARDCLPPEHKVKPLTVVTVDRHLCPILGFGGFDEQDPVAVPFDREFKVREQVPQAPPFISFVLLEEPGWDREAIIERMRSDWGIECDEQTDDNSIVFVYRNNLVTINLYRAVIPDGEAEDNAARNYTWPEAVEVVSRHRAHIMIALLNNDDGPIEVASMHTMVTSSVCSASSAIGVYLDGIVHRPEDYIASAESLRDNGLPIEDWIWVGLYLSEGTINAYTIGLGLFGSDEMEVIGSDMDPNDVRELLLQTAYHIISSGETIEDHDSIVFDGRMRVILDRSPGRTLAGDTLKVTFEPHDGTE